MNTQDERKAFLEWATSKDLNVDHEIWYNGSTKFYDEKTQSSWEAWSEQAKKLEGCVVVPNDQIEVWWQDAEEPENFATQSKDLHFIADGLEDGDIMKIYEHHTIHMPSNTLYGAWIYKDGEHIFITGTKTDVEAARGGNE